MGKTKEGEIIVYMYNVFSLPEAQYKNIWLEKEIVGAQLFSSGLRETLKTSPFKSKADQCFLCALTTQRPRRGPKLLSINGCSNSTCKHLICLILPFWPGV